MSCDTPFICPENQTLPVAGGPGHCQPDQEKGTEITRERQRPATSMSDISTRTPSVENRAMASKNALASGVVTAKQAAS